MDNNFEIKEKIAQLEKALLEQLPDMPKILQTIHRQLTKDPSIVTLLSEEDCNVLVRGLIAQTKTSIVTSAIKKPKKAANKMIVGVDL